MGQDSLCPLLLHPTQHQGTGSSCPSTVRGDTAPAGCLLGNPSLLWLFAHPDPSVRQFPRGERQTALTLLRFGLQLQQHSESRAPHIAFPKRSPQRSNIPEQHRSPAAHTAGGTEAAPPSPCMGSRLTAPLKIKQEAAGGHQPAEHEGVSRAKQHPEKESDQLGPHGHSRGIFSSITQGQGIPTLNIPGV